ncbi:MAG: transcriptional regulator [Reyranella sp.]|uniref:winged helix-turn-helix domain-containing protein n=1 Tax=Reyranella sp. TaxID=1929291 RepID=UPI003D13CDE2
MTETLPRLLLRLSEAGDPAILWGRQAAPHAGRDFERLLDHGVLVEQAPATEWDVCPACDCGLDARPVQQVNGQHIAVCPTDRRSDVVLGDDDLRSFRIHPPALVREIAMASGFGGEPAPVAAGIWHLGETSAQRALFLALSRDTVLQPGMIGLMRSVARSSPMTVIAPAMAADDWARLVDAGLHVVAGSHCIACDGTAPGFSIDQSKLEPQPSLAPRLVIQRAAKTVSLDGTPKTLSDQEFQLLVLLAEHALKSPAIVENRAIEAHIWGASIHRISSQVREPVRALRNALARGSADATSVRALIENRRNPNGYRLAIEPNEIAITD